MESVPFTYTPISKPAGPGAAGAHDGDGAVAAGRHLPVTCYIDAEIATAAAAAAALSDDLDVAAAGGDDGEGS